MKNYGVHNRYVSVRYTSIEGIERNTHLGNVLAVITDAWYIDTCIEEVGIRYAAHITQATDYSAFGAPLPGRSWCSGKLYKAGFNGEMTETNLYAEGMSYDLGARWYDSRLGRMFSTDPLQIEYPWQSTYAYCKNSPIASIDINGAGNGDQAKTGERVGDYVRRNNVAGGSLLEQLDNFANMNKTIFPGYPTKGTNADKQKYWDKNTKYKENFKDKQSYVINNNVSVTFFASGAAHDKDKTGYIDQTISDMSASGISNPVDVNAHGSFLSDASFTDGDFKNYPYDKMYVPPPGSASWSGSYNSTVTKLDWRIIKAGETMFSYITSNNVNGQVNLFGYSAGSVIMAQAALYLANEKNIRIDNLILLGTTIHDNSALMNELLSNKNIGQVWKVDINNDNVSQGLLFVPSFIIQGNDHPHFKYSFAPNAHENRMTLFSKFKNNARIQ